ncbi:4-diphosphocytidyl-2-C-methyl-D-erythritol kinase [Cognatiyoonia sediminum]|uniref:4-diphosphocytidyl-2-C-methyl-D-erythritol kinase n=1 Tax=Cognatiyoonia sediminum TaxID=1508389 RepID=A0A1M5Q017_9RHOB|nr:4-(cytidine 5'-diphospho)-2-C-methyl-D-erythritol kinase [Cognatiyoonia sediminum]SHH07270.1 4-diphosphocytidyl-2-C-methyl-D-erythritol kinase [Cognatiyoonia sediminum]
MTILKGLAPAKINLTLHVTGQREDGYHLLDSLVVFADVGDEIEVASAPNLDLTISGPFTEGVPTDSSNIVLKAANALRYAHGVEDGAIIRLTKNLPNGAGIGGGSSDAATVLSMLAQLWDVPELAPTSPAAVALGADVPVCMHAPTPVRMSGIGEFISAFPPLPECALVLVNPMVLVPTGGIFDALSSKDNEPMSSVPDGTNVDELASWLKHQRNDLLPPARQMAPEIDAALNALENNPLVLTAGMSGSGATCFGLVRDIGAARQVARAIQVSHMSWWVVPTQILK